VANLDRTAAGVRYLIEQEKAGRYPGGPERARQRRSIIARHTRAAAAACAGTGRVGHALRLYRATLPWQIAERRWRFVLGLPPSAALASLRGRH
jgi:hypothetical protein